jgi:hypothetical protein
MLKDPALDILIVGDNSLGLKNTNRQYHKGNFVKEFNCALNCVDTDRGGSDGKDGKLSP